MNQPGPSASKQGRKQSIDEPGPGIPDKNWQRLIDEVNSDAFESWQELFDIVDQSTSNQNQQQSTDELDPSIFDENWIDLFDIADSSTSNQVSGPTNEPNPDTSGEYQQEPMSSSISSRIRQQPIDVASPSTSSQNQQQPMIHNESLNTVPNRVTGLSRKYQIILNGMKQRLVESKIVQMKKLKEYHKYAALGLEQWSALKRGKEISEPRHNPDTEIRLKQECRKLSMRVYGMRRDLKKFMAKHGLEFEEPN
ncbi:hypothetical protein BDEG_26732 [Batrachochytrium dendrobatidis JEL423]|uniref:Uncharacterized protein n=1 Tax=Batrachochytrium dendrobatidis (strain JEL423) TaxID=403673 RepID=A0A177WUN8_BATDL|nr:hypothetical protein BDEG_26732 [Batrachochytrium dendrobatidis JEL423]